MLPGPHGRAMAVLAAAAARGWQLADVRAAIGSGAWPGLARSMSGPQTRSGLLGSCPTNGEKRSSS